MKDYNHAHNNFCFVYYLGSPHRWSCWCDKHDKIHVESQVMDSLAFVGTTLPIYATLDLD